MRASPEGTQRYVESQPEARRDSYRQTSDGLWLSSVGMGTYLGEADDTTDQSYGAALDRAFALGCNVFDCAINYRFQRSERVIGRWLKQGIASGRLRRDEMVIATKGGFVPYDTIYPDDPGKWTHKNLIASGLAHPHEFCANYGHCMAPAYLDQMIAWSRHNLAVETIDIYYLHNPETQHISLSNDTFRARMLDAIETLEQAVVDGRIANYGLATWTAFRSLTDTPDYLSLTQIVALANEVAGSNHHLRYVQLPYNLFMTEAFAFQNQQVGEAFTSAIAAAAELELTVMVSAPLMQGRLANPLMPQLADILTGLETDAQRAIQFVRSSPGVTTALVGMKDMDHVEENLALLDTTPVDGEIIRAMYSQ
jgi:aryl-alcohol dehydrogenase-like predicted oxidoreductase